MLSMLCCAGILATDGPRRSTQVQRIQNRRLAEFVAQAGAVARAGTPAEVTGPIEALLAALVREFADDAASRPAADGDESLLVAGECLTVYHIALSPGLHYPPHDHRIPSLIGVYAGAETQFVYRRAGDRIALVRRFEIAAPSVRWLAPQVIHSVANVGRLRSGAVHVYLGDLTRQPRSRWSADLRDERPFHAREYFAAARPIGSGDAPA
jgi:predicted metal-dependent enzyme (double-stranded beta helix superfamily)